MEGHAEEFVPAGTDYATSRRRISRDAYRRMVAFTVELADYLNSKEIKYFDSESVQQKTQQSALQSNVARSRMKQFVVKPCDTYYSEHTIWTFIVLLSAAHWIASVAFTSGNVFVTYFSTRSGGRS